jgi:hypothetical protein
VSLDNKARTGYERSCVILRTFKETRMITM